MKKSLLIISLALLAANPAFADRILGVYGGVSVWNQTYDGSIRDLNTSGLLGSDIDLENDLGFGDENGNVIYVALEHPIPFIPNIKIQNTEIKTDALSDTTGTITYGDLSFNSTVDLNSKADLSHTDLTLYWQILDNWVSLDIGLTARFFDGFVSITGNTGSTIETAREDFDSAIPLIYGAARFDLPLSGLYAGLNANILGDGDNNFLDYQAVIGYEKKFATVGFGLEAGYRSLELSLDDIDDIEADITIDGAFIGVFFHL